MLTSLVSAAPPHRHRRHEGERDMDCTQFLQQPPYYQPVTGSDNQDGIDRIITEKELGMYRNLLYLSPEEFCERQGNSAECGSECKW